MNSPPDPGSPISTDTESPPPEEINAHLITSTSHLGHLASQIVQSFVGGAKRRQHALGGPSATREAKTRRKMEQARGGGGGPTTVSWDASKDGKREEKDLADHHLVEFLRKEIDDPFQDTVIHERS
ncbi:hypothetical protein C0991_011214 [Blastosporella zonata]|nr:hypothetical protein C0991_011214 [Blastosporella zonata]